MTITDRRPLPLPGPGIWPISAAYVIKVKKCMLLIPVRAALRKERGGGPGQQPEGHIGDDGNATMTGPEHYRRAEQLAAKADEYLGQSEGQDTAGV